MPPGQLIAGLLDSSHAKSIALPLSKLRLFSGCYAGSPAWLWDPVGLEHKEDQVGPPAIFSGGEVKEGVRLHRFHGSTASGPESLGSYSFIELKTRIENLIQMQDSAYGGDYRKWAPVEGRFARHTRR